METKPHLKGVKPHLKSVLKANEFVAMAEGARNNMDVLLHYNSAITILQEALASDDSKSSESKALMKKNIEKYMEIMKPIKNEISQKMAMSPGTGVIPYYILSNMHFSSK